MPNKLFLSAIFIGLHINFEIKAQLAEYYPNPGRGYMSNYKELVNKVANINEASPYYFSANTFKYIYLTSNPQLSSSASFLRLNVLSSLN